MKLFPFLVLFFLLTTPALAANLYLVSPTTELAVNDIVYVTAVLDSHNQNINAFAGEILFAGADVDLVQVLDTAGAVSFWVDKPRERLDGKLSFSGIIPGGINSNELKLFTFALRGISVGSTSVSFSEGRVLRHDGKGTDVTVTFDPVTFSISTLAATQLPLLLDTTPPEAFVPVLLAHPDYFDGLQALYFTTNDDRSGVQGFYIKEYRYWWQRFITTWRLVESPYVLRDQTGRSTISVKAVDGAGNEQEVILPATVPNEYRYWVWLLCIFAIVLVGYRVWRQWLKKLKSETE